MVIISGTSVYTDIDRSSVGVFSLFAMLLFTVVVRLLLNEYVARTYPTQVNLSPFDF